MWCIGGLFAFLGWLILHFSMGKIAVVNLLNSSKNQFNLRIFLSSTVLALIIMDQFQNSIYEREKWLVVGLLVSCNWVNKKMKNTYRTPLS